MSYIVNSDWFSTTTSPVIPVSLTYDVIEAHATEQIRGPIDA